LSGDEKTFKTNIPAKTQFTQHVTNLNKEIQELQALMTSQWWISGKR
jgi:hypothetical protein